MLLQVCHVGQLDVYNTLSDVILNRLLSQLDVVDKLFLTGCEVTSEEGYVTTLPSVRELVSRLHHITEPDIPANTAH